MSAQRQPRADRPRMYGAISEPALLPWSWALHRLADSRSYWIATTRADGRPHTRPVWGVVVDELVHFSTGSLAAGNLERSSEISVHTESATELVIIEGTAEIETRRSVIEQVCHEYSRKYVEALDPDHLPGPFYAVLPRVAFGWLAASDFIDGGAVFHSTATRWRFADETG